MIQPTQTISALRTKQEDVQNGHIIVLHGTDSDRPSLLVVGWTEDYPKEIQDTVTLYEPIMCNIVAGSRPDSIMKIAWVMPDNGLAHFTQFIEYSKAEVYEGVTSFGAAYIDAVLEARQLNPKYERKWVAPLRELTAKPSTQQQQQPPQLPTETRRML